MPKGSVDIVEYFIVGMCLNKNLFPEIDKVYETNSHAYYKAYRESNYYSNELFELFKTDEFIHMKKMTGILMYSEQQNDSKTIQGLIKKGFNPIYRYVSNQKTPDYAKIMELAQRRREIEAVSETELISVTLVSLYLATALGKEMKNHKAAMLWLQTIATNYDQMIYAKNNPYEKQIEEKKERVDKWLEYLDAKRSKFNINNILDNLIEKDVDRLLEKNNMTRERLTMNQYTEIRNQTFSDSQSDISNRIGFLSGMFKIMGVSESAYGTTLEEAKLKKILAQFEKLMELNDLSEEEGPLAIMVVLMMAGFAKEYEDTRENSLKEAQEQSYYEIEKSYDKNQEEVQALKKEQTKLNSKLITEREKFLFLKKKDENQEREIKRLKDELEKKTETEKELIALRTFVFEQRENKVEEIVETTDEDKLKEEDVVIIGGNENWVKQMKQRFPDFTYVGANAVNVDLSFLNRPGVNVFFNTATNSHAQYERVMKVMNKNDNDFYYLNDTTNVDKTIFQMLHLMDK